MSRILVALLVLAFAWPAAAQETGGLHLAPGVGKGPTGLARPMPFVQPAIGASDIQSALLGANSNLVQNAQNQGLGATAGFGGAGGGVGFFDPGNGQLVVVNKTIANTFNKTIANTFNKTIANTINGPVAITRGNNNSVQVQSASGSGPIALQQVNTNGGSGGGNVNSALGGPARGNTNPAQGGVAIPQRHVRLAPANR